MDRQAVVPLAIGAIGLIAAAVMAVVLVTDDDDEEFRATASGFVIEPAGDVGPDAFTPSVEVGGEAVCDTDQFIAELASRPDAVREWSRVLGVPEDAVTRYVKSLEPTVLTEDTAVTNHGLRDGSAYARPSMLEAGTAVLMGTLPTTGVPTALPPPDSTPPDTEPPTTSVTSPSTTAPGEEIPVTRCRCGNPLLPPYAPTGDEPATTTTSTTTTTIDVPPPNGPGQPISPTPDPSQPDSGSTPSVPEPSDPSVPDPNDQDQSTPVS